MRLKQAFTTKKATDVEDNDIIDEHDELNLHEK
jgi:hypothetical protein